MARHTCNAPSADLNGDKPTVISTFAGCGGSSLGYQLAGFRELLAVEWDDNAVATFKLNFPDVPVYHGDIHKLTVEQCCKLADIEPGELDVLDGSPPCQGFSTAGKRRLDDPRNNLAFEFIRLLTGLQPKVFVMENVTGLIKGAMKQTYLAIVTAMRAAGYRVKGQVMNAMWYNMPQSRERVIVIGMRENLKGELSHPKPATTPITVRQAWQGLPDEHGDTLRGPAALVAPHVPPGDGNGGGKYSLKIRGTTSGFGLMRLAWNKPSCTLPKLSLLTSSPIVHPERNERITIAQAKRLASFPDEFRLVGCFDKQWARIGNSVPPNLMRAIAEHIRDNLLATLEKSPE